MQATLHQFREQIAGARAASAGLRLRGSGSKDWHGRPAQGELLDTRAYRGILAYDPTELVITARCGTPLAEIEGALLVQRQMLAFEPPHFGPQATLGGMVASGLSGPRRAAAGAVRDFVLGAKLMDGNGELLNFGGQVMKNVAGYDVSRLLAGSLGTLGLIVEVSLKVLPLPVCEATLRFSMDQADALRQLNDWGGQPLPISASSWHDGVLMLRLSGARAAVAAAQRKLGGQSVDGALFWERMREQADIFFTPPAAPASLWRLSLPSTAAPLTLPGEQWIEWGGAQRWLRTGADAASVRAAAELAGGHATRFRGGDRQASVFHPMAPALASIHRNLKNEFDPAGIFNPGRMYMEL